MINPATDQATPNTARRLLAHAKQAPVARQIDWGVLAAVALIVTAGVAFKVALDLTPFYLRPAVFFALVFATIAAGTRFINNQESSNK